MKERLLTLFAALGTLLFVVVLMLPAAPREEKPVSLPTSVDRGDHGLAVAHDWLKRLHVPVLPLRERYDTLVENLDLPETGNLLVISVPQRMAIRHLEGEQLREWVRRGNHVLLLAAFADWPEWVGKTRGRFYFYQPFSALELRFSDETADPSKNRTGPASPPVTDDAPAGDEEDVGDEGAAAALRQLQATLDPEGNAPPVEVTLEPRNRRHPLMRDIRAVAVERVPGHTEWVKFRGRGGPRSGLVLMRESESGAPALWQYRYGEGSILISRHVSVFNNARLGRADNARLLLNLVNYTTRGRGYVIFDDTHQGLASLYDPDAFWSDPRLYRTLGFLFALWVIYIIGHSNRMLVRRRRNAMLRLASHVEAVGGFLARRLTRAAAARRLLHHFFNQLRRRLGLPQNGQPVWEFIERQAKVEPGDAAQLRRFHERAVANKRINLIKLNNLMYRLREAMS